MEAYWQCRSAIGKTETEGDVLDIHFGKKTYALVDKNTSHLTTVKKTFWSYPADYMLGYDRLYEHHTYGSNGDPPGSTTSATCG
jgi:hypothetical protein